jgi:hypothetical protein
MEGVGLTGQRLWLGLLAVSRSLSPNPTTSGIWTRE